MTEISFVATVAGIGSGPVSPLPQPDIPKSVQATDFVMIQDAETLSGPERDQHPSITPQPVPKSGDYPPSSGNNNVGSDGDGDDVMRLWRIVDELTAELSDTDCRAIYTAIATGVADGWRPARSEVANLVAFAKQQAIAAQRHKAS